MNTKITLCVLSVCLLAALTAAPIRADVVTLKNGDKINGKIGEITGGKMKFSSPVLGDITIDMVNIETFSTDEAATIRPKSAPTVSEKIASGNAEKITTEGDKSYNVADLKAINPPAQKWTGLILANATLARGNTETLDAGLSAIAVLRRDSDTLNDRFTFGAAYNFGNTGTGDNTTTTTDNWMGMGKYDKFFTEKFYGYGIMKVEHDRIAQLNYRLSPGIGVGYQWIESTPMNFFTEAGVSYVYEDYDEGGHNDFVALRLAYHFDKKLSDDITLFHNLEWLPAFEDPGDYNLTTDAGIRANVTKSLFAEFKVEWKRDTTPAEDALENDMRYVASIGWKF
jgi:putative salt-induced outer membrane protein